MVLGVIPARYQSTRLPGKPLKIILDKTLIRRVYENTLRAHLIDRLIVATDDERIAEHVRTFGGEAVMTPADLPSGTDRCAYLARDIECDIVANIQGDEPFLNSGVLDACIGALLENESLNVSTAARRNITEAELLNPNVVKVLINSGSEAIFFSRQNIPYFRSGTIDIAQHPALVHIGLYVYRKKFLLNFTEMTESALEHAEKLEQLRIIENGYPIKVISTETPCLGIDTPEDLEKAERILLENDGN